MIHDLFDMHEMLRRAQRTSTDDATKYLKAATNLSVGGFDIGVDLDADEDAFISQVGALNPIADLAKQLGARCAYAALPPATTACSSRRADRRSPSALRRAPSRAVTSSMTPASLNFAREARRTLPR